MIHVSFRTSFFFWMEDVGGFEDSDKLEVAFPYRDPITLSEDDWGVQSPPKSKVFIGSTTDWIPRVFENMVHNCS